AADPQVDHRDELRLRDGRTIERYSTLARGPEGDAVGRVWFFTDITERKRDEEALRFLTEATDVLYSSLDYETTLRRVADLAVARSRAGRHQLRKLGVGPHLRRRRPRAGPGAGAPRRDRDRQRARARRAARDGAGAAGEPVAAAPAADRGH